jgi:hypothetical protein
MLSLLLTLVAVPAAYSVLDDLGSLFRRRRPSGGTVSPA